MTYLAWWCRLAAAEKCGSKGGGVRKVLLWGLAGLCFCFQAGCSVNPVDAALVEGKDGRPGADRAGTGISYLSSDAEDGPCGNEAGRIDTPSGQAPCCRLKYHPSYSQNRWMVVEATLDNGRSYPLVLDTGASVALFVNDIHVSENHLSVHSLENGQADFGQQPRYYQSCLPPISIGAVRVSGWPCFYRRGRALLPFFGLPASTRRAIIAGLPLLQQFRYILFDSVNQQVELSVAQEFVPQQPERWSQYPFVVEQDLVGNAFLFVRIPVAGVPTELQLDTGSGRGLAVRQQTWQRLQSQFAPVRLTEAAELYPYIGRLPCKKATIPAMQLGSRIIHNARVAIFPDDSPVLEDCDGLVGMEYFNDTVVVLDFGRSIMWVRN